MTSISWVLALTASGASARDDAVNVALEFNAPVGCSDRETFAAGLRSRSERIHIAESSDRGWLVHVRLTPKEHGVHGELRLTDEHGESELRAVDGVDCAEVVEALSLTAALAIEQTVALATEGSTAPPTGSADAPAGTGHPNASAAPLEAAPPLPSATPPSTKNPSAPGEMGAGSGVNATGDSNAVGAFATVSSRVAPQTSFGLMLTLTHRFVLMQDWMPELTLGVLYFPSTALQPKSAIGVRSVDVALHACPIEFAALRAAVTLSPCAVFELSRLTVVDRTVDVSYPSRRMTAFAGALGRGRVHVTRHAALELHLGVLSPLSERRYLSYSPIMEVAHTRSIAWQADIGWLFGW